MESMLRAVLNRRMLILTAMLLIAGDIAREGWESGYRTFPTLFTLMGIVIVVMGWHVIQSKIAKLELGKEVVKESPNQAVVTHLDSEGRKALKRARKILDFIEYFLVPLSVGALIASRIIDKLLGFKI